MHGEASVQSSGVPSKILALPAAGGQAPGARPAGRGQIAQAAARAAGPTAEDAVARGTGGGFSALVEQASVRAANGAPLAARSDAAKAVAVTSSAATRAAPLLATNPQLAAHAPRVSRAQSRICASLAASPAQSGQPQPQPLPEVPLRTAAALALTAEPGPGGAAVDGTGLHAKPDATGAPEPRRDAASAPQILPVGADGPAAAPDLAAVLAPDGLAPHGGRAGTVVTSSAASGPPHATAAQPAGTDDPGPRKTNARATVAAGIAADAAEGDARAAASEADATHASQALAGADAFNRAAGLAAPPSPSAAAAQAAAPASAKAVQGGAGTAPPSAQSAATTPEPAPPAAAAVSTIQSKADEVRTSLSHAAADADTGASAGAGAGAGAGAAALAVNAGDAAAGSGTAAAAPAPATATQQAQAQPAASQIGQAAAGVHVALGAQGQVTLQLHPGSLGAVQVHISRGADGAASVSIQVENADTLQSVQRDVDQLHQALERAGFAVAPEHLSLHLAVAPLGAAANAGADPGPWQGGQQRQALADPSGGQSGFGQGSAGQGSPGQGSPGQGSSSQGGPGHGGNEVGGGFGQTQAGQAGAAQALAWRDLGLNITA